MIRRDSSPLRPRRRPVLRDAAPLILRERREKAARHDFVKIFGALGLVKTVIDPEDFERSDFASDHESRKFVGSLCPRTAPE